AVHQRSGQSRGGGGTGSINAVASTAETGHGLPFPVHLTRSQLAPPNRIRRCQPHGMLLLPDDDHAYLGGTEAGAPAGTILQNVSALTDQVFFFAATDASFIDELGLGKSNRSRIALIAALGDVAAQVLLRVVLGRWIAADEG